MRNLPFILLLAIGCRQMLDLEPAELEVLPATAGSESVAGAGGQVVTAASGGDELGGGRAGEPAEAGSGSSAASATGGQPPIVTGGGGGTEAEGGSSGSGPLPPLCEQYCGALEANCTGDLIQYADYQTCLDSCALLPPGEPGDVEVNSVQCRLAEADKAGRLEPEFYCPLAGPASAGKCGTSCEAFCDIMAGFCTSESTNGLYFFEDEPTCLEACALLPLAGEPYSAALHAIGPHFECRLFHASASNIDAEYHCGHAFGDPPCNGP